MTSTFAPRSGARIAGRYELKKHIRGTGAVQVFRALDHQAWGECALVLFDPERCGPGAWGSFVRVVTAGADAKVPGLAVLAELPATPSNPPYCVTGFPSGRGLDELRRQEGRQDWKRALSLGVWFAEILNKVYGATRVAHRALTPARCIVGAGDSVTVLDYGVAELEVPGSPSEDAMYRAPEQQRGGGDVRSDVYSLAAILFELIAGERPSPRMPPLLRSIVREAPKEVEELFARALAREPGRRFADLAAMGAAMQKWSEACPRAVPSPPRPAPALVSIPAVGLAPASKLDDGLVGAGPDAGPVQIVATSDMAVPPLSCPLGVGSDEVLRSPNPSQKDRTEGSRPATFGSSGSAVPEDISAPRPLPVAVRGLDASERPSQPAGADRTEVFKRLAPAGAGKSVPLERTEVIGPPPAAPTPQPALVDRTEVLAAPVPKLIPVPVPAVAAPASGGPRVLLPRQAPVMNTLAGPLPVVASARQATVPDEADPPTERVPLASPTDDSATLPKIRQIRPIEPAPSEKTEVFGQLGAAPLDSPIAERTEVVPTISPPGPASFAPGDRTEVMLPMLQVPVMPSRVRRTEGTGPTDSTLELEARPKPEHQPWSMKQMLIGTNLILMTLILLGLAVRGCT